MPRLKIAKTKHRDSDTCYLEESVSASPKKMLKAIILYLMTGHKNVWPKRTTNKDVFFIECF